MDSQMPVDPIQHLIALDEKNKLCFECKTAEATTISVNQGITLCEQCSSKHKELGYAISLVVPLKGLQDRYIFDFVLMGGNNKLETFLSAFQFAAETTLADKYKSKAMDYYRRNLKSLVYHLGEIMKDFEDAQATEVAKDAVNVFPEFETYEVKVQTENKFFGFFKKLGNEVKEVGTKAGTGLKAAGTFIGEKTKNAYDDIKNKVAGKKQEGETKTEAK